jgi:hypothetical protein
MRYFRDGVWAAIRPTLDFLSPRRNATTPPMAMVFPLQSLLDVRRNAEQNAQRTLALAATERAREEEEQQRLRARWQDADAKLEMERKRLAETDPANAAQAIARQRYLGRLRDEAAHLLQLADEHRGSALTTAATAEDAAQAELREAHAACAAVEKLEQRARSEEKRALDRRAEDAASDLTQAKNPRTSSR